MKYLVKAIVIYLFVVLSLRQVLQAQTQLISHEDNWAVEQVWEGTLADPAKKANVMEVVIHLQSMAGNYYQGELIYKRSGRPMAIDALVGKEDSEGLTPGKAEPVEITENVDGNVTGKIKGMISLANDQVDPVISGIWSNHQGTKSYTVELRPSRAKFTGFIKPDAALKKFPGFSRQQMVQLLEASTYCDIPLPTYLPAGFRVSSILVNMGPPFMVAQEDKALTIVYSCKTADGNTQSFAIEGGFDGLGDVPYKATHTVKTSFETLDLYYEPLDIDDGKPLKDDISTQWFALSEKGGAFMYVDYVQNNFHGNNMGTGSSPEPLKIPLEETKKIIASLKKL